MRMFVFLKSYFTTVGIILIIFTPFILFSDILIKSSHQFEKGMFFSSSVNGRPPIAHSGDCNKYVKDIYYVKLPKSGSSTLVTMFYKWAMRRKLNILAYEKDPYPTNITKSNTIFEVSIPVSKD